MAEASADFLIMMILSAWSCVCVWGGENFRWGRKGEVSPPSSYTLVGQRLETHVTPLPCSLRDLRNNGLSRAPDADCSETRGGLHLLCLTTPGVWSRTQSLLSIGITVVKCDVGAEDPP